MLFQAIDVLKNIDYQSQYVVETLLWLDSIALGAVVGLIIAAIIYLFGFTFNDLYNEDYFYLFIVVIIIILAIGNLHTHKNYQKYLYWIKAKNQLCKYI